jgi:hypothetical protein
MPWIRTFGCWKTSELERSACLRGRLRQQGQREAIPISAAIASNHPTRFDQAKPETKQDDMIPLFASSRLPEVNSLGPHPQLLIALHSPDALLETGLRMYIPEKSRHRTASDAVQCVLRSPICLGIIAKYGHYSHISARSERNFSALQTAWRRKCDSNSHYRFESRNPRRNSPSFRPLIKANGIR